MCPLLALLTHTSHEKAIHTLAHLRTGLGSLSSSTCLLLLTLGQFIFLPLPSPLLLLLLLLHLGVQGLHVKEGTGKPGNERGLSSVVLPLHGL